MGIYKLKNSKNYWMRKSINGIKYCKSTETPSKMRAMAAYEEWVPELKETVRNGGQVITKVKQEPKQTITFRELSEKYIGFIENRLRSAKNLKFMVNKMILVFQEKPLNNFTLNDIESIQNDLLSRGLSIRTANHYPRLIKTMFRKAADWELVDEAVVKKLVKCKNLKGENKRLRYLSEEEAERLIESCDLTYLRPVIITALNTGMRRAEILKLTWQRVDLKNRIILLDKTKNDERREIPINDTLYDMLSGMVRNIASDYVFYNPKNKAAFERLDRSFHTALKKAKITDFHFHDLRHTFASRLVMNGVDLAAVQKLLGHKSITMTLRYAHLSQAHVRNAVNTLDNKKGIEKVKSKKLENIENLKAL